MVKIKVKKYMDLAELIKWAVVNGITNKRYVGNKGGEVYFDGLGRFRTSGEVYPEEIFEEEVEEEIDENTKIPVLVEVAKVNESSKDIRIYYYRGISISEAKKQHNSV